MRTILPLLGGLLAACNPGGTFEGKLVDAMSGQPRADVRVLAKAERTSDLTCQVREATTDANGVFRIDNTCPNTTYTLKLGDETLLVQDSPEIAGGQQATGVVELTVWRAPAGSGVFRLQDDKLTAIRTFADIEQETIQGTDEVVRFPSKKPLQAPTIDGDARLIVSGKDLVRKLDIVPLVPDTGVRTFASGVSIEDHVYLGVKFTSDTEFERVEASLDKSRVQDVATGDRLVRYISADALPPGRYALVPEQGRRLYVVDFGSEPAPAARADTP